MGYPTTYGACIICGAAKGEPCDTVGDPGTPRPEPHFYRASTPDKGPQGMFVAARDEPDYGERATRFSPFRWAPVYSQPEPEEQT